MRQHYWEKWSDSDPLMWSVWPENNPKIKHNMKLYSSYLHKTNAKKKKKIESSQSQKLDYWLWQSFLHLFVPIKLLELNWERQTKEKKMLSSWNPSLLELIPCQRLLHLPSGTHHCPASQHCGAADAAVRFLEGTSRWLGTNSRGQEKKGAPFRYRGPDGPAPTRVKNSEALLALLSSPGRRKGRRGRKGKWERTQR